MSEGNWEGIYGEQQELQPQEQRQQEESPGTAAEDADSGATAAAAAAATTRATSGAPAEKKVELILGDSRFPLLQLQGLQQQKQQLYRQCIALTRRQTAACQQHSAMDFGTFALVREQINHIGKKHQKHAPAAAAAYNSAAAHAAAADNDVTAAAADAADDDAVATVDAAATLAGVDAAATTDSAAAAAPGCAVAALIGGLDGAASAFWAFASLLPLLLVC